MLPSKAVGRYSYQLVALSDMMETGAQGFPPKNGPPVFQAAEDKAPGLQPASVQQHGASAPKTLTAGAAGLIKCFDSPECGPIVKYGPRISWNTYFRSTTLVMNEKREFIVPTISSFTAVKGTGPPKGLCCPRMKPQRKTQSQRI